MRKISLVLLSIGALLALSIYWQGPASADGISPAPPEGFGKKIAGSWYDEFMHYPNWPDEDGAWPGTGVLTLGADGTLAWSSVGPVGDQAGGGTWERTGQREITLTVLIMGFAADPIPFDTTTCVGGDLPGEECADHTDCPGGVCSFQHSHSHAWTARSEIVFEFDEDFQTALGIGCTDAFWPGEDPLSEDPNDPFYTLPYVEHTFRKVNVVPCSLHGG